LLFFRLSQLLLNHVDLSALEADRAVSGGEQRKIPAHTDIETGEELGSALTNDYRAGSNRLATKALNAPILRVAVSAVS
jgi:hypothetical protein